MPPRHPNIPQGREARWLARVGGPLPAHATECLRVELDRLDDRWRRASVRDHLCELRAELALLAARASLAASAIEDRERTPEAERNRALAALDTFAGTIGDAHATLTAALGAADADHDEVGDALAAGEALLEAAEVAA